VSYNSDFNNITVDAAAELFKKRFDAKVLVSHTHYYSRYNPINVHNRESAAEQQIERQPCIEIVLPRRNYTDLAEQLDYFYKIRPGSWTTDLHRMSSYENYLKMKVDRDLNEDIIRKNNPAVNKAYQHYLTLIALVENDHH
jgi:hypothetical protein